MAFRSGRSFSGIVCIVFQRSLALLTIPIVTALGAVPEPAYRAPWGLKSFPISKDARVTYIGFEIESSCEDVPFVPIEERENVIVSRCLGRDGSESDLTRTLLDPVRLRQGEAIL